MTGAEFIRAMRKLGRRRGIEVRFATRRGKGSHGTLYYGERKTIVKERGAAQAVADINAAGGVLGEQVELITVDDLCDPEQAVAAAKKLVSDGVIFVVGHYCSGPRSRHRKSTRRRGC